MPESFTGIANMNISLHFRCSTGSGKNRKFFLSKTDFEFQGHHQVAYASTEAPTATGTQVFKQSTGVNALAVLFLGSVNERGQFRKWILTERELQAARALVEELRKVWNGSTCNYLE